MEMNLSDPIPMEAPGNKAASATRQHQPPANSGVSTKSSVYLRDPCRVPFEECYLEVSGWLQEKPCLWHGDWV